MNTNCKIVDYSEKSCAVIGDTKSIKDNLKQLGCKFNNNLMIDDEKVPGWIFSKKVRETVEKYLNSGVVTPVSNKFDYSNNWQEELKKYVLKKDYDDLLERVKKLEEQ